MSDVCDVTLRHLSEPESTERRGQLVSSGPDWAELELTDGGLALPQGSLLGFQTSQTISVGHVESGEIIGGTQRLRVRVDHWLASQDVSSIQKLWTHDQPD